MEPLAARIDRQRARAAELGAGAPISVALAPYRVCPLGAHVDHQGGPVLGMAIGASSVLAFAPASDASVRLVSSEFPGEERFRLDAEVAAGSGWGRYPRAAARALGEDLPERPRGVVGALAGTLPGGGLGSSASVLVAFLLALARANEIELDAPRLVDLARRAENRFVGVASGILDPASVVGARRGRLLHIDTRRCRWEAIAPSHGPETVRLLVAYTGVERNLSSTSFNRRVEECRRAARRVAGAAGLDGVSTLGDLPEELLEASLPELPPDERGRARHFLEEGRRVRDGLEAWRRGDLPLFGRLMVQSCESSVTHYETGSREQIALQGILLDTPGVIGARFSGAGYGGCSVALVEAGEAEAACRRVWSEFVRLRPEARSGARVFLAASEDGARLL